MKLTKKILAVVLSVLFVVGVFAGCSANNADDKGEKTKSSATSDMKVGFIFLHDENSTYDKNFITAADEACKTLGIADENKIYKTNVPEGQECAEAAEDLVDKGCSIIFADSFGHEPYIIEVAKKYPDVQFCHSTGTRAHTEGVPNYHNAFASIYEGRYLAGVAAAKTTKTKIVGFVGGMEGEVISRFEKGFEAGVKSVDKSIKVQVDYAGSFSDAAKGKTIAATQYAGGADIIYQAAGGTGAGVFSEAKSLNEEKKEADKVWVLGVDRDQKGEGNYTSKDGKKSNFVLASTTKGVGEAVQNISKETAAGKFPGGKHVVYGIKEGAVGLVNDNLSDDAQKAVDQAYDDIKSGKITVPEK